MQCGARAFSLLSLTFGLMAAGALSLAVATDFWVYTSETFPLSSDNETEDMSTAVSGTDFVSVTINMHSGLWRMCIINIPGGCDIWLVLIKILWLRIKFLLLQTMNISSLNTNNCC